MAVTKQKKRSTNWSNDVHESRFRRAVEKDDHRQEQKEMIREQQQQQQQEDDTFQNNSTSTSTSNKTTKLKKKKKNTISKYQRSILLSHENHEKKQSTKLRLHISKTKKTIDELHQRLKSWDDISEQISIQKSQKFTESKKRKAEYEEGVKLGIIPKDKQQKRKGRLGPETWKLRGAARPAYEVYDFDTRYVDPHLKALEEAKERAMRSVNVLNVYKGKFGDLLNYGDDDDNTNDDDTNDDDTNDDTHDNTHGDTNDNDNTDDANKKNKSKKSSKISSLLSTTCRDYLSHSTQYALLNLEAKKYKTARQTFLDILDLEGYDTLTPPTNSRDRLMRLYLDANRPSSARSLWERLPIQYNSVWIRFSHALLEYVSWKILEEEGSTYETTTQAFIYAIKSNVYCAYYIAYHETFSKVFEYVEDVEDAEDGSLEQAIEYCNSEQVGSWIGTEGVIDWLRVMIVQTLNLDDQQGDSDTSSSISSSTNDGKGQEQKLIRQDLEWENKLEALEDECEVNQDLKPKKDNSNGNEQGVENDEQEEEEDDEEADTLMFAGMFRTSMDILTDAGAFKPSSI